MARIGWWRIRKIKVIKLDGLSFNKFIELAGKNASKKYIPECIDIAENQDCIFDGGSILSQERISSLYKLRLQIAKENGSVDQAWLQDFENCVARLTDSKSLLLGITWINGNEDSYLIFYEPDTQVVLGVLKSRSASGINVYEARIIDLKKGATSDAERYYKGRFIRNYKQDL